MRWTLALLLAVLPLLAQSGAKNGEWPTYGADLGNTHYFSLVFRWDTKPRPEQPRLRKSNDSDFDDTKSDDNGGYKHIFDFLNDADETSF